LSLNNEMNLLFSLFFILLPFTSTVLSQGAVQSPSLVPSSTFLDPTSTSIASPKSAFGTSTSAVNSTSLSISTTATITAQFPTLSNVSSCVSTCLAEGSARLNCISVVDVNCFCVNALYPSEIVDCVLGNCPNQVATIESLAQQFCSIASVHPTLTFPAIPTTSTISTSTSIPTSNSTTATQTPTPTSSTTPTNSTGFSTSGSTSLLGLGVLLILCVVLAV